jgi:hypothetical protein
MFKDCVTISGMAQKILNHFMWEPIWKFVDKSKDFSIPIDDKVGLYLSDRNIQQRIINYEAQDRRAKRGIGLVRSVNDIRQAYAEQRGYYFYCKKPLYVECTDHDNEDEESPNDCVA